MVNGVSHEILPSSSENRASGASASPVCPGNAEHSGITMQQTTGKSEFRAPAQLGRSSRDGIEKNGWKWNECRCYWQCFALLRDVTAKGEVTATASYLRFVIN